MKPKYISTTSAVTLILALPAGADVIYSNLKDIAIPTTFAGVYLDVDTGNWNTDINAPQSGWDVNPFFGGSSVWNSPNFQPVRTGTDAMDPVVNVTEGSTVGGGSVFSTFVQGPGGQNPGGPGFGYSETHMGNGVGQFDAVTPTEGYLGFRLNGANYGSMRVIFTNNTGGALIKDWAYDTSGASVTVGAIKQVGQNIVLSSGFALDASSPLIDSGGTTNLVKNGSGTNTLKSASTFTGTTTVNAGVLAINGSIASTSTVTVASTGTLRGTGSIAGPVTIQGGGTLAAGDTGAQSIQTLSTATLTLGANSTFAYDADNDATVGVAGDLIAINGNLNFDLATAAILTLNDLGTGSWSIGEKLTLLSYSGSWSGVGFSYLGNPLIDDSTFTFSGMQWAFNYNDTAAGTNFTGDLVGTNYVTMTAVPEPNVAAVIGGLGLLALLRRRR